jgi:hypothetical protein
MILLSEDDVNLYVLEVVPMLHTKNLGFYPNPFFFGEMGQSSIIVTLYEFSEKIQVGCDIFGGSPFRESKC